jgi:hypothetical protein
MEIGTKMYIKSSKFLHKKGEPIKNEHGKLFSRGKKTKEQKIIERQKRNKMIEEIAKRKAEGLAWCKNQYENWK